MRKLRTKKKKPNLLGKAKKSVSRRFRSGSRRTQQENFILKTPDEIVKLKRAGHLVAKSFEMLRKEIKPGAVLKDLDRMVEDYITSQGAQSLYKGYRGNPPNQPPFPSTICASINHEICHGFANERVLNDGDIIGIDIGLKLDGYCGDACYTFAVGNITEETQNFLKVSEECLYVGIAAAQVGNYLGQIGQAIEDHAHKNGLSVVERWGGHGIGKNLHEPVSVPHHGPPDYPPILQPGMTFTIEPMINMGTNECETLADEWTVVTLDGKLSAQYEHTIAITPSGPEILSKVLPNF
ncbi:MAG: type I methionyl aminopeptidase [Chloroflexota bacterium]